MAKKSKSEAYNAGKAAHKRWSDALNKFSDGSSEETPPKPTCFNCFNLGGTQEYEDWHEGFNDAAEDAQDGIQ